MRPSSIEPSAPPLIPIAVPTLTDIFLAFTKIGLTSFGGGLSGWMFREFVQRRAWLSETEFLSGLALAQAFPGVNVVNLSIWIGFRLRNGPGALAGALGITAMPMVVAMALVGAFSSAADSRMVHVALAGIAAAAVGLSLQTGLRAARKSMEELAPLLILAVTFICIFAFRLPLLWVVGVMAPLSIGLAFLRQRARGARREL
jgi:chromate transporter